MSALDTRYVDDAAPGESADERRVRLSVLLVTDVFLPISGGTEVSTLREAKALQARGYPARVLTLRHNTEWPATEEIDGVRVLRTGGVTMRRRLRMRFGATWLAEARVWYELVRTRRTYDVVQLRQLGRLVRPAVLASLVTSKPLVVRIACAPAPRGGDGSHPGTSQIGESRWNLQAQGLTPDIGDVDTLHRVQFLAPLTLWLLRAQRVTFVALSTRIQEHLVTCGFSERQIVLLPNGIDPRMYEEVAACRVRCSPAAPGDRLTVICPARLSFQKGQDVLLQAWRIVQARVPAARLILAGDGPQRSQLERLAADLGVSGTVEFPGLAEDMRALLATAYGFVLPSRYEGMPNALLEAMAAGLPCVATRVSGTEDVIVDGQSGLLVPPEDPEALASALVEILTDYARARTLAGEARARVERDFNQSYVMDQLTRLYSSLVRDGGAAQHKPQGRSIGLNGLTSGAAGSADSAREVRRTHRERASSGAATGSD